ncbi:hypothetical protein IVB22_07780 [Bradyrhizobium sp. 190]|uniref:hypothetical protein n=1 Tax=Bradyrhizobium sp. 190 TaxID=2782658 RepID=UPI001FF89E1D|nr:hypothetical protein [Bradyrhizobium sp. 190]MCK1512477.1 hypothetical protein [Bradyrhizobium sp. 190]
MKLEGDASQKAATDAVKDVTQSRTSEQPSVIIVEVLGSAAETAVQIARKRTKAARRGIDEATIRTARCSMLVPVR